MTTTPKLDRKELKEPDQFQVLSAKVIELVNRNKNIIATICFLILIALAGAWYFLEKQKSNNLRMESLFYEMDQLREKSKGQPDELIQKLKEKFNEFDKGDQRQRAALILADVYYQNKKYDEAISMYSDILSNTSANKLDYFLAQNGKGHALEGQKKYKEAIGVFKGLIDKPSKFPLFYVYLGLARCYELAGDSKNSVLILREMKNKYTDHVGLEKVDTLLKRLEGSIG